ncbi:hypothetical protein M2E15_4027 [Bacillus mycoides]|nr:hypothetical protein M2E15_4027 [Bacillus mycoides]OSX93881.1 hypothetical protein BTJ44_01031 [Bacillus mycoides]OSY02599.1 hypothetical protein S2E19_03881 [Bacillus mycoides]
MFILGSHQHAHQGNETSCSKTKKCIFLPGYANFLIWGVFSFISLLAMGSNP